MGKKVLNITYKIAYFLVFSALHAVAVGVLVYTFWPIATWYFNSKPLWGVDFFLSVNIASLIDQNVTLPFAIWNYAGFAGWPQFLYPTLSAYFITFISNFYDLIVSVQIMVLVSSLLFIVGSYFLFYQISKNIILSVVIAVFVGLSGGVYQVLTWAGSLPSYTSQMAFPWSLGFLVWYLRSGSLRFLLFCALISGISIWIHPLVFMTYISPSIVLLTAFTFNGRFGFIKKIKTVLIFFIISFMIGFPQFYLAINSVLNSAVRTNYGKDALSTARAGSVQIEQDIANFNKAQVSRIITDNHIAPFYILAVCLALFLTTVIFTLRPGGLIEVIPYGLLASYFTFYIWIFGQGISIYHGGWYRLFWSVPVLVGALSSALWFASYETVKKRVKNYVLRVTFVLVASFLISILAYSFYSASSQFSTISSIVYRSEVSSAYPDILNLKVTDSARAALKARLAPAWFNGDETNWRIYSADQTVNLWWNSIFRMPLARGYIDPPIPNSKKGFSFLLDASFSEEEGNVPQLTYAFNYPEEAAASYAQFLIDWNAVKYFEGPHVSVVLKPLPKYLEEPLVMRSERIDFSDEKYTRRPTTLNYIEFKDGVASPILSGTNAPTMGIFASENGYEIVVRALAERDNLNSQVVIPLKLGRNIDDYGISELKNFDALYLHDYDYKNQGKTFKTLRTFLERGGRIYVDTGTEVRESSGDLPDDLFPVKKVTRRGQGMEWDLENTEKSLGAGVDFSKFSPPDFDGAEWNISYAEPEDVKSSSKVILKNKGKTIMASQKIGNGEFIWGGFNFAYHVIRDHNVEEAKFFNNILSTMIKLEKNKLPQSDVNFVNPNERVIKTQGARGVLFKEQAYDGWSANLISGNKTQSLKIYKAGPAYPGFMYVVLPDTGSAQVKFNFSGSLTNKILIFGSLALAILLFEEVVFSGIVLGRIRRFLWLLIRGKVGRWWQKEDE